MPRGKAENVGIVKRGGLMWNPDFKSVVSADEEIAHSGDGLRIDSGACI